jgi:mannose-6-phosphate isomerase-like protein (cupin superfamily)
MPGPSDRSGAIVDLASIPGVPCPCGSSHRAFLEEAKGALSVHLVEIREEARAHYHRRLTEVYYFLEGEGGMELDGRVHPVRPGYAVLIRPGTRHRAVPGRGPMKVLNIVVPGFDPSDEWFE